MNNVHTVTGFQRKNRQTFVQLSNGQSVSMTSLDIQRCDIRLQDTVEIMPSGRLMVMLQQRQTRLQ